jgi:hypothetical protein
MNTEELEKTDQIIGLLIEANKEAQYLFSLSTGYTKAQREHLLAILSLIGQAQVNAIDLHDSFNI